MLPPLSWYDHISIDTRYMFLLVRTVQRKLQRKRPASLKRRAELLVNNHLRAQEELVNAQYIYYIMCEFLSRDIEQDFVQEFKRDQEIRKGGLVV